MIGGFFYLITFEPEVVSGTTIYVGSGAGNDSASINGGIGLASDGFMVFVYNGTYYENVIIDKTINLTGEDRNNTIINGSESGDVITISANWVNITGFTITGSGSSPDAGIILDGVQDCRIYNNNILNTELGIHLEFSNRNNITGNKVTGGNITLGLSYNDIYLYSSSGNTIEGNICLRNYNGVYLSSSNNNMIINNTANSNINGIHLKRSSNNSISSNTASYNGDDGIRIIIYSNNNIIINNNVSNSNRGIFLFHSSYNNLTHNIANLKSYGITLVTSSHNNIENNIINSHGQWGITIEESSNDNTIIHNDVSNNGNGIYLGTSNMNEILENNISYYEEYSGSHNNGIHLFFSNNNTITSNNILENNITYEDNNGIWLFYSNNNTIESNKFSDNDFGIRINGSSNNTFANNTISLNKEFGLYLYASSNNTFHHNNIIYNEKQVFLDTTNCFDNIWDDSMGEGNYWSDYKGKDDGSNGRTAGDGIGDTEIPHPDTDMGNGYYQLDNYPLMNSHNLFIMPLQPPILYINVSLDAKDIILYWDPPPAQDFDPYMIYRSTDSNNFDFNSPWVNTLTDKEPGEVEPIPERTMWNDTNAAFLGNATNYKEQYYYVIRAFNDRNEVSSTSRTVGKWTKTFPKGISTFSLPLEPIEPFYTDYSTRTMKAEYIKFMNATAHTWEQHNFNDGNINNTLIKMGEGYEVKVDNQTNHTFTGLPGAMISYDDDSGFFGFNPDSDAKNLTVFIEPNGDVNLTWLEPEGMGAGDWYKVFYSNTRDGFFGTFNVHYFPACPAVNFGNNTATHIGANASDSGSRLFYMVVPFNATGVRGSSTYSIGIWTEEYLSHYDTLGIPLKLASNHTADWYCNNISATVGINYYIYHQQRWGWHSNRMPGGAYDPLVMMTEGYQISTSNGTKFTFIGV